LLQNRKDRIDVNQQDYHERKRKQEPKSQ
jgi:hypothetical protein